MTLVKFNRGNRANGNTQPQSNQSTMPTFNNNWPFTAFPRLTADDLIQDFFDDSLNLGTGRIGTTLPAVNISETDTDLVIEVAAPGMKKNDFKISVADNQLHIGASKEVKNENN